MLVLHFFPVVKCQKNTQVIIYLLNKKFKKTKHLTKMYIRIHFIIKSDELVALHCFTMINKLDPQNVVHTTVPPTACQPTLLD